MNIISGNIISGIQRKKSNRFPIAFGFILFTVAILISDLATAALAQTAGRQLLSGHVPQAVASSQVLHEVPRETQLNLAIGLPLRNQDQLNALLTEIADPASANYKHYLTPEQFAAEFGPTQEDYQALVQFAQANGLTVTGTHSNRVLLDVTGAVPDIENALHVKMMTYRDSVRGEYYAPDREPSLDLDVNVLHINGLDNYVTPQPMSLTATPMTATQQSVTGSGPNGDFIGGDFRAAYAPDVTLTGSGQSVGLVEFDGFYANDEQKNFAAAGLPQVPTQTVLLDGFNGTPGSENIEVMLDIMMASYMAPGLSNVTVYEGIFPDDILNRMATDDTAKQLSSSWGFGTDSTTLQIFEQFIAQGQSFLQASGDQGAYKNGVMSPSDNPNVTVIGGTALNTAGQEGPWSSETGWSGSGGGVSTIYTIPSYQQGFNKSASGGSTTMRNIPDVAMVADPEIYLIYDNGVSVTVGGTSAATPLWAGFIALANQQAQTAAKSSVGFLNPILYAIGNSGNYSEDFNDIKQGNNGYAAATGYDLVSGWGSPAGQHLIDDLTDASTGSFTISSAASSLTLFQANTVSTTITVSAKNDFAGAVGFEVIGLPSGVTAAVSTLGNGANSLTFTSSITTVPGTYKLDVIGTSGTASSATTIVLSIPAQSFTLSSSASDLTLLVDGSSLSSTIAVNAQNGFDSKVSLTVSGVPAGITASLSAASTATTSTLTLRPSATTVPGVYLVTVTGTSGTLTSSTSIVLDVPVPSFSLSSSLSSLTLLVGGSSETSTIAVVNPVGLNSNVALTVSGLPTGVTASFSPSSTSTSSTLTLKPGATAVPGTYTVTVNGASTTATNTTSIELNIPAPAFSLSSSVSSLTLLVGGTSGTSTIAVVNPVGLSGNVALTVSGLPTGVTATFSPASTSTSSTLTLKPGATAVPGTYTVTVNGASTTATNTTSIQLNIPAPAFSLSSSVSSLTLLVGGTSGTSTVAVSGQNGFDSKVSLAVSGVPTGVTATFSSASTSTTSTLTLKPSATSVPGTYTVTVTGTSGTLTSTISIVLTIPVPSFSLSASTGNFTMLVGGTSGTSTIGIVNPVGLSGNVALTVSGLPTGVTASFSPSSTSTSSTLTLKPGATAVPGTYTVTVTGTSATATNTTGIELNIPAPSFSLSASTSNVTPLVAGASGTTTVEVSGQNGFDSKVSLTVSGVPAGVTATFSSTSTSTTSTLTLKPGAAAVPGTYTVTVTGTSGTLTSTTGIALLVP